MVEDFWIRVRKNESRIPIFCLSAVEARKAGPFVGVLLSIFDISTKRPRSLNEKGGLEGLPGGVSIKKNKPILLQTEIEVIKKKK